MSPRVMEAAPGAIVSVSFRVTNTGDRDEEYIESLDLPPGWQAITAVTSFTLAPGVSEPRIIAFSVPRTAAAAGRQVTYSVRSQRDYDIQDADSVTVAVLTVERLALLAGQTPDTVIAGNAYEVEIQVINQGNAAVRAKVEAKSDPGASVTLHPTEFDLPGGGSELVTLQVRTTRQEAQRRRHNVHLTLRDRNDAGARPLAALTISVDLIPRITRRPDLTHRVPATLTLSVQGDDDGVGAQAELRGRGFLDERRTREVDFRFRGPDTQDNGVFGRRDEYRFRYSTDSFDARIGDQSYSLSRLTSQYRYGRGVAFDLHNTGGIGIGGYYRRGRWTQTRDQEAGMYLRKDLSDTLAVTLNLLEQQPGLTGADGDGKSRLWSVEATAKPTPGVQVSAEYAQSSGQDADGSAYRIEADGRMPGNGYFTASKIHAEPTYDGYYRDADYTTASLSMPINDDLQAHASYQRWKQNLALDPVRGSAPDEGMVHIGFTRQLPSSWWASAGYERFRRRDLLEMPDYDYRENAIRLGVGRSDEKYSFSLQLLAGSHEDRLTHTTDDVLRAWVYANYRPRPGRSVSVYAGLGDEHDAIRDTRLLSGSRQLGTSVAWEVNDRLSFGMDYVTDPGHDDANQLDFRATYARPDDTSWILRARRGDRPGSGSETSYEIAYSLPIGVPAGRKRSVGVLHGRVYDADAPGQPGIRDVVLSVDGATAVTNRKGRFSFPALAPGSYDLHVDRVSIGLQRVTESILPLRVEVEPGRKTRVELAALAGARLGGTVSIRPPGDGASATGAQTDGAGAYVLGNGQPGPVGEQPEGLANILVELSNEQETLRRTTDARGRFLFGGLRPGAWRLKVHKLNLPPLHDIVPGDSQVELASGDGRQVHITVVPRQRKIRMLEGDEDDVIVEAGPESDNREPGARRPDSISGNTIGKDVS